jgi:sigma-B regulation protein RsbU (phosphoserine phosphatase)
MSARATPLRRKLVTIFAVSTALLLIVIGGSLGLLWQRSATLLADSRRETAEARWHLSLEQMATAHETLAASLGVETEHAATGGHFDREAMRERLLAAMHTAIDPAPITRIDIADSTGLIASTAGLAVRAPLVDIGRTLLALRRGYAMVGPERSTSGRWRLVVSVAGPGETIISIASDLTALLPTLASSQRAEMFLIDEDLRTGEETLAASTSPALWNQLRADAEAAGDAIFTTRIGEQVLMAVPLPLHNSSGTRIGRMIVVRDITAAAQRARLVLLTGAALSLLLVAGTGFLVYALTRDALDPLGELTRIVRALAGGNLAARPMLRAAPAEIEAIGTALDVFRGNAIELDRHKLRERLHDAQNHRLIRREMSRLAETLDEPARGEVLEALGRIGGTPDAAPGGASGSGGAGALAAAFQLMSGRVAAQQRQMSALLEERTRDLQIVSEALAEREQLGRLREEMEFARHLQMASLPAVFPPFPERRDVTLFAAMTPASEVGGDFYDFALIEGDTLVLLIGDASGKGVSAAMFIATCRALLRSALVRGAGPGEALAACNAAVTTESRTSMFATVFAALLDLSSGRMRYANAGHNPPYILRGDGAVEALEAAPGIALGVIEPMAFDEAETVLQPGEALFLFTDGVTEAHGPERTLYEETRLTDVLRGCGGTDAETIVRRVAASLAAFMQNETQADDITMLSVTRR